jgi:cathepsin A (carboxypeptidase C)
MIQFYQHITPKLARTIVYNGDTDPCVSYEGTRIAISEVWPDTEYNPSAGGRRYRPWFYNATSVTPEFLAIKPLLFGPSLSEEPAGAQYGGSIVNYAHGLSFMTVHGSGHMVPQFRPRAGFHLVKKLVTDEPLSPATVSDDELGDMTDDEFNQWMNKWTTEAQSPPYVEADPTQP